MSDILDRYYELKENYYLDSLKEADLSEQSAAEEPVPDPPMPQEPAMPDMGGEVGEMEGPPGPIEGVQGDIGGMGMEPGMMGMEEPPKDPTYLGRVYELSKIYYRLHVLHQYLMNSPDRQLEHTRKITTEAFDIFKLIVNNLASYKEKIDDIILQFYNFLANLAILLAKHAKEKEIVDKKREAKKTEC